MSWKPEVIADSSKQWIGNELRFATEAEALANVANLKARWMMVIATRAVESDDPVNYAWVDGRLVSVPVVPIEPALERLNAICKAKGIKLEDITVERNEGAPAAYAWGAWIGDYDLDKTVGTGPTNYAATEDLLDQLEG